MAQRLECAAHLGLDCLHRQPEAAGNLAIGEATVAVQEKDEAAALRQLVDGGGHGLLQLRLSYGAITIIMPRMQLEPERFVPPIRRSSAAKLRHRGVPDRAEEIGEQVRGRSFGATHPGAEQYVMYDVFGRARRPDVPIRTGAELSVALAHELLKFGPVAEARLRQSRVVRGGHKTFCETFGAGLEGCPLADDIMEPAEIPQASGASVGHDGEATESEAPS